MKRHKKVVWFRSLLAEHGTECTLEEAMDNYYGLMLMLCAKEDQPIDEIIDRVQKKVGPGFHPEFCRRLAEGVMDYAGYMDRVYDDKEYEDSDTYKLCSRLVDEIIRA